MHRTENERSKMVKHKERPQNMKMTFRAFALVFVHKFFVSQRMKQVVMKPMDLNPKKMLFVSLFFRFLSIAQQ